MNFCPQCGAANAPDARFCEKCGGALTPGAPTTTNATVNEAVDQAKDALAGAQAAIKKMDPKLLIGIGALVVLLLVALLFLRPMSENDYEDKAEDAVNDLWDARNDIEGAIEDLYYADADSEDDLDEGDVEDARAEFKEKSKELKKAASAINALRPPSKYKDEDEALRAWAAFYADEYLKGVDELLTNAEDGMTYGEFSEEADDWYDALSDDSEDINEDFSDAVDELNIR